MIPPHTRFNVLFRKHLIYHSRSLNPDKTQHSSLESVPEDYPNSLDRPRNTNVDGRGLQLLVESQVNCVDCTLSDSDRLSFEQAYSPVTAASYVERRVSEPSEAGNFAAGAPRLLAEAHIFQRQADISDVPWQPFFTSQYPPHPFPECPSSIFPPLSTSVSTYSESVPTTTAASTSSAYDTPQPSNLCGTSVDDTSSCAAVSSIPSSSGYLSQSTSSLTDHPQLSSASLATQRATQAIVASTSQILATTSALIQPLLPTVTSINTAMVSSQLPQPSSVPNTTSNPQLSPIIGAIIGGIVGVVVLLALLIFIVLRRRRKQLSVTPFNLFSTAGPTQGESRAVLKAQNASDAIRPSSGSSSFIQYSDACLADYSGNRSPSCATDLISSHFANDEISWSSVARRYRSHALEKLYPNSSHVPVSDQNRHRSVQSWVEYMVTDGYLQEPSEELPAYPYSVDLFRNREVYHDDHYVLPSS